MLQKSFNPEWQITSKSFLLSSFLIGFSFSPTAEISDHVSYSVPRPIHRPMHRSIYRSLLDRPSTDTQLTCRSTVDRESTDVSVELPLMSAELSTVTISGVYRSTTSGISVSYRQNVGRVSFDSRARVYRYNLPIYRTILSVI